MPLKETNNFGEVSISENVIRDITYKSLEIFLKEESIFTPRIEKDIQKNVKITKNEDESITVTIRTAAKYGENIVEFSRKLQGLIKTELEKMSELFVNKIDVFIDDLEYPVVIEEPAEIAPKDDENWSEEKQ
ncbi:MAG TPA: Asp23/Gls24 family envelope stress response protein [Tepiditoga sp.]|nr:Asp23/Gls24 family envelope stress response protein [Tepiditoga sp.]